MLSLFLVRLRVVIFKNLVKTAEKHVTIQSVYIIINKRYHTEERGFIMHDIITQIQQKVKELPDFSIIVDRGDHNSFT